MMTDEYENDLLPFEGAEEQSFDEGTACSSAEEEDLSSELSDLDALLEECQTSEEASATAQDDEPSTTTDADSGQERDADPLKKSLNKLMLQSLADPLETEELLSKQRESWDEMSASYAKNAELIKGDSSIASQSQQNLKLGGYAQKDSQEQQVEKHSGMTDGVRRSCFIIKKVGKAASATAATIKAIRKLFIKLCKSLWKPWLAAFYAVMIALAAVFGAAQVAHILAQPFEGRAVGGPVNGGQTYLVGEAGPELLSIASDASSDVASHPAPLKTTGIGTVNLAVKFPNLIETDRVYSLSDTAFNQTIANWLFDCLQNGARKGLAALA